MGVASFDHTRASSFCNSGALKLWQGIGLFSPSCVCLPARLPLLPPLPLPAPLTVLTTTKAGNMRQPVAAGRKAKAPSRSCCKSRTSEHSIPAIPRALSFPSFPSRSQSRCICSRARFAEHVNVCASRGCTSYSFSSVSDFVCCSSSSFGFGPVPFPHLSSDSPRTFVHMHFYCSCHKCSGRGGGREGSEVGERSGERTKNVAEIKTKQCCRCLSSCACFPLPPFPLLSSSCLVCLQLLWGTPCKRRRRHRCHKMSALYLLRSL